MPNLENRGAGVKRMRRTNPVNFHNALVINGARLPRFEHIVGRLDLMELEMIEIEERSATNNGEPQESRGKETTAAVSCGLENRAPCVCVTSPRQQPPRNSNSGNAE